MKICLLIPFLMLTMVSCQTKPKPVVPKTDMEMVEGDWVLAGFKTDPSATGKLSFKSDLSFSGSMNSTKGKQPDDNSFSGKYALSHMDISGRKVLMVDLAMSKVSGKSAAPGTGMRLSYDPVHNALTDLLMIVYARPGDVERVRKELLKRTKAN